MAQAGGGLCLALEATHHVRVAETLAVEYFEGDAASQ